ncbi:MAG TPA: AMP-binding protein, partial [Acidimicrobiales bacterium]|nr:AMP-binding protein [Acidimicrobiales bacterium]
LRPARFVDGAGNRSTLPDARPVDPGDALVVATSGTTGAPKGVVLTHDAVAASAEATSARLAVDPGHDSWLACLPLAHIGGLSVVTRALATGTPVSVAAGYDPDSTATLVSLVPTVLERHDTSRFRAVVVGGSGDWRVRAPNVVHTYGMTETGSGIVYDGVALDGVDVRVDPSGEILVRGPMLLRGYRGAGGDGVDDPKDADGWLATGDLGAIGDEGRLTVFGRAGDVIVTGGEKVWPDAVEQVLRAVSGVGDVAVAGVDDEEWGQRVVAWIVPDGEAPSLPALRDVVKQSLPAYAAPKELVVVEALPRTPLGKLRRNLLVENR